MARLGKGKDTYAMQRPLKPPLHPARMKHAHFQPTGMSQIAREMQTMMFTVPPKIMAGYLLPLKIESEVPVSSI